MSKHFQTMRKAAFITLCRTLSSSRSIVHQRFYTPGKDNHCSLEGKTALVTGSTQGIGLGIAKALAAEGASVMLNGFGTANVIKNAHDEVRSQYKGSGKTPHVLYHAADLSKVEEIEQLIRETYDKLGSIDILINNAGIQFTAPIESFPVERYDAIIALNLSSVFHTTRLVLPLMREKKWGRIINISSVHGLVASKYKSAYVAAKHGVVGLTKVTALETAGQGITCNSINPGWVRTALVEAQIEAKAKEKGISIQQAAEELLSEKQPSLQFATPEQIGRVAVFLCSDAAAQITGISLPVDGGWTAQ